MEKLVLGKNKQLVSLLTYIRDHQMDEKGVYKEMITDYMEKQKLCSRLTTLGMINTLLQEKVLLPKKIMNYRVKLSINEQYDFDNLLSEILSSELQEMRKKLEPLTQFTDQTPKSDKALKMTLKHLIGVSESWQLYARDKKAIKNA